MPTVTPNWEDVRFDRGLAAIAADRCDRTADAIGALWSTVGAAAGDAVIDWDGRSRTGFDGGIDRISSEQAPTVSALRTLAADLRRAAARAEIEQHAREQERRRWELEVAAERAAAVPRPVGGPF